MAKRKKKILIRYSDNLTTRSRKIVYTLFRFLFYGMIGVFAEVCFYTLIKICRLVPGVRWIFQFDWRVDERLQLGQIWIVPINTFFGQCSLWMFLVYAFCALFAVEWIYRKLYRLFWVIRAILYGLAILAFEFGAGFLLYWITGYQIWYYNDPLNLLHMTSLYILPIWCITGMLVELIYRELMQSDVKMLIQKEIDEMVE